ncbi:MAG: response regulator [Pirellulales bacterium]
MNEKGSSPRRFRILLVEDNDDDVLLTKHAFKCVPEAIEFQVARDGLEALNILRREPPYDDASLPLPHVVLLDLNMPRMDGRQLLRELKGDEALKVIPIIILTTSAAKTDIATAYLNNANAYMTKPMELQEFADCTKRFADFWLSGVAILPS